MSMKKKLTILLILTLPFFLSACDDADYEILADLLIDWSHENGLIVCIDPNADPATCEVKMTAGLNTWLGAQLADYVADKLAAEALKNGHPSKYQ